MPTHGLIVAAASSHAGKTLVTAGLIRALIRRGHAVAAFKTGPDYIDPQFLAAASGRPAVNLDPWAMRADTIAGLVAATCEGASILVGEGVMGLFDGASDGRGSTADLALALGLPVVLVVDVRGMGASVAALVQGFVRFRPGLEIAAVILNGVAGDRHRAMLARALVDAGITSLIGSLPRDRSLQLPERHLGLVQAGEIDGLEGIIERCADRIEAGLDLAALELAMRPVERARAGRATPGLPPPGQRIAVARDTAFGFHYPGQLAAWAAAGAAILPFSPLADEPPDPHANVIWLPGGYPELHAPALAAGTRFMAGLRSAAVRGVWIHGECGGYMVLGRALIDANGRRHAMAGLLDVVTSLASPWRTLGYRRATALADSAIAPQGAVLRGHEFHYAVEIERHGEPWLGCADAMGRDLGSAGARRGTVAGSFVHLVDLEAVATPASANVAIPA